MSPEAALLYGQRVASWVVGGFSVAWGIPVIVIAGLLLGVYAFFSKK